MFPEDLKNAICRGDLETIKKKTQKGKYITLKRPNGNTLLHIAALCGNYKVSLLLLERFHKKFLDKFLEIDKKIEEIADELPDDWKGWSLINYYCSDELEKRNKLESRVKRILKNKKGESPLYLAAKRGNINFLRALIDFEMNNAEIWSALTIADIIMSIEDLYGNLPIHTAVANGQIEFLRALKEYKCYRSDLANYNGNTPLHKAVMTGNKKIVKFLLNEFSKNPAEEIEIKNNDGLTPEHLAVFLGYDDIASYIRQFKENLKEKTKESENSNFRIVEYVDEGLPIDLSGILENLEDIENQKEERKNINEDLPYFIVKLGSAGTGILIRRVNPYNFEIPPGFIPYSEPELYVFLRRNNIIHPELDIRKNYEDIIKERINKILNKSDFSSANKENFMEKISEKLDYYLYDLAEYFRLVPESKRSSTVEEIVNSLFLHIERTGSIPSGFLVVLSMINPKKFKDFIVQTYKEIYDYDEESCGSILRNILNSGSLEIGRELFSLSKENIFLLSEASFGITERILKEKTKDSKGIVKLLEDILREILLGDYDKLNKRELKRVNHPIVEIPVNIKPTKDYLTIGLLLAEILLKFKNSFISYYENYIDPSLPEEARPQLLYVTRALIRFLEGCGKSFDEIYEEFKFIPERYNIGKKDFRNLTSEIARKKEILE
jgi:ankyrin repeat protein